MSNAGSHFVPRGRRVADVLREVYGTTWGDEASLEADARRRAGEERAGLAKTEPAEEQDEQRSAG